jgi:large repetitive protein
MIRSRLSRLWGANARRRTVMKWTAATSVLVLLVVGALVATGYQAQRVNLDDGAVWVTNGDKQAIGRANTKVFELNTVLTTDSSQMDLVQNGQYVFLINDATRSLDVVNQATGQVSESVPLPQDVTYVALAGENVILHAPATGDVWVIPSATISTFDAQTQPANFTVGADSAVAVNSQGFLVGVSASLNTLSSINTLTSVTPESSPLDAELTEGKLQITLVGNRWIVFDSQAGTLYTAGRVIQLQATAAELGQARLQVPSDVGVNARNSAASSVSGTTSVLLATNEGLRSIDLDSGDAVSIASARGRPAAPLIDGNCAYAAWTGGSVWSKCAENEENTSVAESMAGSAALIFRVSDGVIALNDDVNGLVWAVQGGVRLIDNWDSLLAQQALEQQVVQTNNADAPEYDKTPQPPVAVDDELGARPGRVTALAVLLNDYDPNGDALVIDSITGIPASLGELFINAERNHVMVRLADSAAGSTEFDYTISDGRGEEASATVTLTVRPDSENSPPGQARPTRTDVALGSQVIVNVLGDWIDPDGDAIFVAAATTESPDSLSYTPAGRVAFTDSGRGGGGAKQIALEVSDGRASGYGSVNVNVKAPGQVPIIAEAFAVIAIQGQPITINPSAHIRGGTGVLSLTGVPAVAGLDIVTNFADFSFSVTASRTGSTYLTYAVTDGDATGSGLVRLDVIDPPEVSAQPITAAHAVFVPLQQSRTVDVTATDRDPAGGVLVVTGTSNVPLESGIQVEVVDHRLVRVTLTKPLSAAVSFSYRVSNGISQSEGTITVVQTPAPVVAQAPVAIADVVAVRVGDVISIPVLANDIHPDGGELTLASTLDQDVPAGAGLLFVSGNQLRFLAGSNPGTYSAVYRVNADNGQWASGAVTIAVRAIDEDTNQAPTPRAVIARAMSGQTVRIPIPLVGIDPDGDSVQFVGLDTNPEKGSITSVGSDWVEYEASAYATGTDSFSYSVVDALGAQASAQIRVGIAEPLAGGRNPVAVADNVVARPGYTVYVRALRNDSDPDGRPLTLVAVTAQDDSVTAEIVGDLVKITAPMTPGRYGLVYEIENDLAGSASNFITLEVQAEAPLSKPLISDAVVSLTDILGNDTVDVNVMSNAFFADGPVSSLRPSIVSGYGATARVISANIVRVQVLAQSQIIPFSVAHPDDPSVTSTAFIWVPGTDDALPQRKRGVAALTVVSEQSLRININDYVIAALGKNVKITDAATVRATHADGSRLVVNDTTLSYTSEDRYFGPASISFEVTDGDTAGAHLATIVLPITVTPRENMPPVMLGANIDLEPGQEKTLDLVRVTRYPYADDQDELEYSVSGAGQGITATLNGQILTLKASDDAVKGRTVPVAITVKDKVAEGSPGAIIVRVVPSTRPLAIPVTDSIVAKRGETQSVDVLANDQATNPFPGQPLKVLAVRGLDGGNIPAGVTVTPSADKATLTVTVSANAEPSDTTLEYEVADATNDSDRFVWGVINISVQDVPSTPQAPTRAAGFVSGTLTLSWPAPAANNSAITKYTVESDGGYRKECTATICSLDGLPTGQRFRFTVSATNSIGTSLLSSWSDSLSADVVPAGPAQVNISAAGYDAAHPDGGGINVSWSAVGTPSGGSPVSKYVVTIVEDGTTIRASYDQPANVTNLPTLWLTPGHSYVARVTPQNSADTDNWNTTSSGSVVAIGAPQAAGGLVATQTGSQGESSLSWNAVGANGANTVTYYVKGSTSAFSAGACPSGYQTGTNVGSSTSWNDSSNKSLGAYNYVVYADNGFSCVAQITSFTVAQRVPGAASYLSASCVEWPVAIPGVTCGPAADGQDFTLRFETPTVTSMQSSITVWQMQVGSSWVSLSEVAGASTPTYELRQDAYFQAGGTGGTNQTVVIRGCTASGECGAGGTSTTGTPPPVYIPTPAP